MPNNQPVRIDVVSDVVCPWCFIGKHRLEKALALKPDIAVEVHWRPYFLNDWIPREGISREEYLTTKFGSPERYKGIAQRVTAAAAAEGLTYAIRQDQPPAQYARLPPADPLGGRHRQGGRDEAETDGPLFHAKAPISPTTPCWCRRPPMSASTPTTCAQRWRATRTSPQVEQEAQSAKEAGIEGVPCFIFGGKFAVSGAQAPEYLADAIERAAQSRRSALPK